MIHTKKLHLLQKKLEAEYCVYTKGFISQKEYCTRAKPIDMAIEKLEMSTLQGTPVLKAISSLHFQMQEH